MINNFFNLLFNIMLFTRLSKTQYMVLYMNNTKIMYAFYKIL